MRRLAFAGAGVALASDVVYVLVISRQGIDASPTTDLRVPMVAAVIALCGLAAGIGAARGSGRFAALLLALAGAGLGLLGLLAIFSVGLLLLVAAGLVLGALVSSLAGGGARLLVPAAVGGGVAVVVLFAGFWLTDFPVACTGTAAGAGSSMLRGGYQWTCDNGRLSLHPDR